MPHPDPLNHDDRSLQNIARRLLAESTDSTDGPLNRVIDRMVSAAGPSGESAPRSRRYAAAILRAAAVEAVLAELTEKLAEAEWYRAHAEAVADRLIERVELEHQIITGLEDEPPGDDVNALVSLVDGRVWVRDETVYLDRSKSEMWHHAEVSPHNPAKYEWPLEGGPFIPLPDIWHLRHLVRQAAARDDDERKIRDLTRSRPGYSYPYAGGFAGMVGAVLAAADRQRVDIRAELQHERQKLHDIRRVHSSPNTPLERHELTMEILDRPAHDAPPPARPAVPRCHACGHAPHTASGCFNMASDGDCDCREDSLGGPIYDGDER